MSLGDEIIYSNKPFRLDDSLEETETTTACFSMLHTPTQHQAYQPQLKKIKPQIFRSLTGRNIGTNSGNLNTNTTDIDDFSSICTTKNFMQNSASLSLDNQISEVKVENNADCTNSVTNDLSVQPTQCHTQNLQSPPDIKSPLLPTNAEVPFTISKTGYFVQDSTPSSRNSLSVMKTSFEKKVCTKSSSLVESQDQCDKKNQLLSSLCKKKVGLRPHNELNSSSYLLSVCDTQLQHGDILVLKTKKQQIKLRKIQGSNYSIDGRNKPAKLNVISQRKPNFVKYSRYISKLKSQSNEKKFTCPYCSKKFLCISSLRVHVQLHRRILKTFNQKISLKRNLHNDREKKLENLNSDNQVETERSTNDEQNKTRKNSFDIEASGSVIPPASLVPTIKLPDPRIKLSEMASMISNSEPKSNLELSVPSASSETIFLHETPVNDNSYDIEASRSDTPTTSLVTTTSHSTTNIKLSDMAFIRSNTTSNMEPLIPAVPSETGLLNTVPPNDQFHFSDSHDVETLQSAIPSTLLVPMVSHSSTYIKLSDTAYIRSNTESNIEHSGPAVSSETVLLNIVPPNDQFHFSDGTEYALPNTSKGTEASQRYKPSCNSPNRNLDGNKIKSSNAPVLLHTVSANNEFHFNNSDGTLYALPDTSKGTQVSQRFEWRCNNFNLYSDGIKVTDLNGRAPFTCHILNCSRIFNNSNEFRRHLAMHTSTNSFFCTECDKEFTNKDNLANHIEIHKSFKQNRLNIIENFGGQSSQMISSSIPLLPEIGTSNTHVMLNDNVDISGSEAASNKQFLILATQNMPVNSSMQEPQRCTLTSSVKGGNVIGDFKGGKLHICHIADCGKVYNNSEHLKLHLGTHAKKRYFCVECNEGFTWKYKLYEHLTMHNTAKPNRFVNSKNYANQALLPSVDLSKSFEPNINASNLIVGLAGTMYIPVTWNIQLNTQLLIPTTSSEMSTLLAIPAHDQPIFNSPENTLNTSMDTSKDQSCLQNSLPTMPISTALLSLNYAPLLKAEMSQSSSAEGESESNKFYSIGNWSRCPCLNCSSDDTKMKDSNGTPIHMCHIPGCRKILVGHFKRHLLTHSRDKNFFCTDCNKSFLRKDQLLRHLKVHISTIQD